MLITLNGRLLFTLTIWVTNMADKTPDVKVIPAGSKPLTQRTAEAARRAEAQRVDSARQRLKEIKTQSELPIGHRDKKDSFAKPKTKGTQAGHSVTTSGNHTKPVASRGGGKAGGSIGDFGGGGMNWETK